MCVPVVGLGLWLGVGAGVAGGRREAGRNAGRQAAPELVLEAQVHDGAQELAVAHERLGRQLVAVVRVRLGPERLHHQLARRQPLLVAGVRRLGSLGVRVRFGRTRPCSSSCSYPYA